MREFATWERERDRETAGVLERERQQVTSLRALETETRGYDPLSPREKDNRFRALEC